MNGGLNIFVVYHRQNIFIRHEYKEGINNDNELEEVCFIAYQL